MRFNELIDKAIENEKNNFHFNLNLLNEQKEKIKEQEQSITFLQKSNFNLIKELTQKRILEEEPNVNERLLRFLITPNFHNINIPIKHKIVFLQNLKEAIEEASNMNDSKGAIIQRLDAPFKQIEYLKE